MPYSVLIIGAGRIAAGYDNPNSEAVLTHAHAVSIDPRFHLLGFYDPDRQRAQSSAKKWNAQALDRLIPADVVVVCSPDAAHLESVKSAAALNPRIIVLEKPIARDLQDAEEILALSQSIPIQVNFTRRFAADFQKLPQTALGLGDYLTGTGLYGKGFIHNGSHMIDLLRFIVGEIEAVEILGEFSDCFEDDRTKTARIRFENGGEFYMRGIDCSLYTVFELELCFEKGRIKILDSGNRIQTEHSKASETHAGYVCLALTDDCTAGMRDALPNLYSNIYESIRNGKGLIAPVSAVFSRELYSV
jgi:predicted dehydrogenase